VFGSIVYGWMDRISSPHIVEHYSGSYINNKVLLDREVRSCMEQNTKVAEIIHQLKEKLNYDEQDKQIDIILLQLEEAQLQVIRE